MNAEYYFCEDASPVFYNLLDFSIAPPLLYYAYIPTVLLLFLFSAFILYSDNFSRNSKLLSALSISLAGAILTTLLQWIAAPVALVMFAWQLWNLANVGIFLFTAYFAYSYFFKRDLPPVGKVLFGLLYLPVILLTPTTLNIPGFDYYYCEGLLGPLFTYAYIVDFLAILFVVGAMIVAYRRKDTEATNRQILIVGISSVILLSVFLTTTVWADIIGDYRFEMIGPIGAVVFLVAMAYISVKYRAFNVKLLATEFLVIGIVVVIGSILFLRTLEYVQYVAGGSLVLVLILGWLLTRSVRKEVRQRKQIEELAENLKKANARLKILDKMKSEFVSIASHQLRSPLTSIRGYASMLQEGSYGKLSTKAKEAVERIADSSRYMALSVEDYLNVSRIEAGNMKYEKADFNLKNVVEKIVDEMRPAALKKGLLMLFKSDCDTSAMVHADIGKTRQVIMNLIDNAMKYTPKGSITVFAHDDAKKKKMYVTVEDTGVGMSKETMEEVFDKFIRAKNANEINVTGTGLGLFVAKRMVEEMSGRIWAESEGEGKGSKFHIELPLVKG